MTPAALISLLAVAAHELDKLDTANAPNPVAVRLRAAMTEVLIAEHVKALLAIGEAAREFRIGAHRHAGVSN